MEFLKAIDLSLWWNKLIAVGLAMVIAALAAKERSLIMIGLGMIAWGFGEARNHGQHIQFTPRSVDFPAGLITSHPRINTAFGLVLDAAGLLLIGYGLYQLLTD